MRGTGRDGTARYATMIECERGAPEAAQTRPAWSQHRDAEGCVSLHRMEGPGIEPLVLAQIARTREARCDRHSPSNAFLPVSPFFGHCRNPLHPEEWMSALETWNSTESDSELRPVGARCHGIRDQPSWIP